MVGLWPWRIRAVRSLHCSCCQLRTRFVALGTPRRVEVPSPVSEEVYLSRRLKLVLFLVSPMLEFGMYLTDPLQLIGGFD